MSVFNYLKSKIIRSSLKAGSVTVSQISSVGVDAYVIEDLYNPARAKLQRDIYSGDDLWDQLKKLSWEDQTVSHGVWSTVRGASQNWWVTLKDSKGKEIKGEGRKKEELLSILRENSRLDKAGRFDFKISLEGVRQQMLRSLKVYGAIAAEAVLDKQRKPKYIKVVNPKTIKFKEPSVGVFKPYQVVMSTKSRKKLEISLDVPNFFWHRLDPDFDSPYSNSPMTPVVNTIYFQIKFLEDLQEVVKKTAWPRISAKLMEDVLYEQLPLDIKNDQSKYERYMAGKRVEIARVLQNLEPGQAFVSGNYVELSILESKGQAGGTLNPAPLLEVVERHSAQSMKTFASVLGVTGTVDPLQQFMENQSLKGYQSVVEDCMSDILTFFYRAMGKDIIATFKHRPQELRPESELEPARSMKMSTDKVLLAMGAITPEEFSLRMTGTPMPDNSILKNFYNDEDLARALLGFQESPDPSDTDDSSKSPGKPTDPGDGRSDPDASVKKGKKPAKKKTGDIKSTPKGGSRKPRRK
jgi:hypothetical protein